MRVLGVRAQRRKLFAIVHQNSTLTLSSVCIEHRIECGLVPLRIQCLLDFDGGPRQRWCLLYATFEGACIRIVLGCTVWPVEGLIIVLIDQQLAKGFPANELPRSGL